MTPAWIELEETVLKHDYCCGCGICAGACPHDVLAMKFNENGEYRPYLVGDCPACGICYVACPFAEGTPDEDELGADLYAETPGIKQREEVGYYLNAYVGHVGQPNLRWSGASGGLTTWLLEKLLREQMVDAVLCVSPNDDPQKLFHYVICRTAEEVRRCSRSCYYPVTTQEVLEYVAKNEGRYAIVGLPCVCTAIRLAQQKMPKLRRRIAFILGLVCGQTKGKAFAEYVCALGGGDPHEMTKIEFRVKDGTSSASNFGTRCTCKAKDGKQTQSTVLWSQGMGQAWNDRYFALNACNFCDDLFAECADAAFMDAWLPQYSSDPKGHNLLLTRNAQLDELFRRETERPEEISVQPIDIDSVIRSQIGVLCSKRGNMRDRIAIQKRAADYVPTRRWSNLVFPSPIGQRNINAAQFKLSHKAGPIWLECNKDLSAFKAKIQTLQGRLDNAKRKQRSLRHINTLLRKLGLLKRWATSALYS